jgi:hypothetical protein
MPSLAPVICLAAAARLCLPRACHVMPKPEASLEAPSAPAKRPAISCQVSKRGGCDACRGTWGWRQDIWFEILKKIGLDSNSCLLQSGLEDGLVEAGMNLYNAREISSHFSDTECIPLESALDVCKTVPHAAMPQYFYA